LILEGQPSELQRGAFGADISVRSQNHSQSQSVTVTGIDQYERPKKLDHKAKLKYALAYEPKILRRNYILRRSLYFTTCCLLLAIAALVDSNPEEGGSGLLIVFFCGFFVAIIFCLFPISFLSSCAVELDKKMEKYHADLEHDEVMRNQLGSVSMAKQLQEKLDGFLSREEARKIGQSIIVNQLNSVGDITVSTGGGVTISGRNIVGAVNAMPSDNDKILENAISELAGYVKTLKDDEVTASYNDFTKSVSEKASKRSQKSLWNSLVDILPDFVKISDAVVKLTSYFNSPGAVS
jgi:hypothetical protein